MLVVEDDPILQMLLEQVLNGEGYQVHRAGNGQEALELLVQQCPDVILLDLMMPVMDGMTFLRTRQNRDTCRRVPVLVVTARPERLLNEDLLGVGGLLQKPFDVDALLSNVARLTALEG